MPLCSFPSNSSPIHRLLHSFATTNHTNQPTNQPLALSTQHYNQHGRLEHRGNITYQPRGSGPTDHALISCMSNHANGTRDFYAPFCLSHHRSPPPPSPTWLLLAISALLPQKRLVSPSKNSFHRVLAICFICHQVMELNNDSDDDDDDDEMMLINELSVAFTFT